jgi:hypothetical protein
VETSTAPAASERVVGMEGDQQHGCGCRSDENSTQHWLSPSSTEDSRADTCALRQTARIGAEALRTGASRS